ncbi:ABC transporter permease [Actinoplanes sp. NBRC 101535]|uniref:ABC transporter permease n=1 Tax=Actinoplanes sp. NBRC 101535 TaxID=3032196 RepID=UPI0024A016EE|nr:ABC transporter permease [Actinoplanes sp. NBRC 101535]GLY06707.1 ABC transporter permease [Actinoplanes sp. NBRC 101535]
MIRRLPTLILISVREISTRKGRALLACLSLVVGILAVIFVQATAGVARAELIHLGELRQGRSGTAVATVPVDYATANRARQLATGTAGDHVDVAAVLTDSGATVAGTNTPVPLTVYAGDLRSIRPFDVREGRFPTAADTARDAVVVNNAARAVLGDTPRLTWTAAPGDIAHGAEITGVIDDGELDPHVYVGWDAYEQHAEVSVQGALKIFARMAGGDGTASKEWLTSQAFFQQVPLGDVNRLDVAGDIDSTLAVVQATFLAVGVTMLLVGVMGVVNIGLATLKERAEELALRRSLGATKLDIGVLVLAESTIIGMAGSLIAVAISLAAFPIAMATLVGDSLDAPFPALAALAGMAAGALAGAVGGLIPAIRSANMPIATVMRA